MTASIDSASPSTQTRSALSPLPCSAVSIAREYGDAGLHLEFQPHGYPFPIVLPVITRGSRDAAKAWTWNGSTEKPTLKPSIKTTHPDGTVSHIWLTDGMCQHLSDSTDGLAGQTLPLLCLPNTQTEGPSPRQKL